MTIIEIKNNISIETAIDKNCLLNILNDFLKDKIVVKGTHNKQLGMFNGLAQLSSKLIQHLENLGDKETYPATIWVHNIISSNDEKITISLGDEIILTKTEIQKVKEGKLGFQTYARLHNSNKINIDGKPTIKNLNKFKKTMEERVKRFGL